MVPETLVYILTQSRVGRMSNRLIAKVLFPDVHSSKNRINRFRGQSLVGTETGIGAELHNETEMKLLG